MTASRPQDIGPEFEDEFTERHGLRRIPGSGAQWHSKLDARGRGARWSLKATADASYRIKQEDLLELLSAHAPGQDGDMRLMAIKIGTGTPDEVVVIVGLEEDLLEVARGEVELVVADRTEAKRKLAATPELLREED